MNGRLVIDASVAIKWVVPEAGTEDALALRTEYDLCAPELIIAEIANILWKKHRRGELSREEAELSAELLANSGLDCISMASLGVAATNLAVALAHPAYDCLYLAAAIERGCPFVTADASLIRKLRQLRFDAVGCLDLLAPSIR